MSELCFALRPHREYYVAHNECYALDWHESKKMVRRGWCGTKKCPFYKPHRDDIRLDSEIITVTKTRKRGG